MSIYGAALQAWMELMNNRVDALEKWRAGLVGVVEPETGEEMARRVTKKAIHDALATPKLHNRPDGTPCSYYAVIACNKCGWCDPAPPEQARRTWEGHVGHGEAKESDREFCGWSAHHDHQPRITVVQLRPGERIVSGEERLEHAKAVLLIRRAEVFIPDEAKNLKADIAAFLVRYEEEPEDGKEGAQ